MKYIVLIIDGAAGLPLQERGGKTSLEAAITSNLDAMAKEGSVGLARTVPPGMEPGSAVACMSVIGYDPAVYYKGRASIEAASMGIPVGNGQAVFRCNLVNVTDGKMRDYSAGHITSEEAAALIKTIDEKLGNDKIKFYPGVSYRHILKLISREETLEAVCTPPHDISGKAIAEYLPKGKGGDFLLDLMKRSEAVLKDHPVNIERVKRGELPATTIWLFWGSGRVTPMPPFKKIYGLKAVLTSGVDLLKGLGMMSAMDILDIKGVTDGPDSNNVGQIEGALKALINHDLAVVHIEAPDELGHTGNMDGKIKAIEKIDAEVVSRLCAYKSDLRVLIMPDHPTPISVRTHTPEPVPFLMWGKGIHKNGAARFTELEGKKTGLFFEEGHKIMARLTGRGISVVSE
ncbi:MAG TPA: cofactor-independent phosphoglycerate mutase [Dehalococcoidales bacterium]|nr:cofactor-independent phosphoglycerate mutase [Dehalococcoidales bacterium]